MRIRPATSVVGMVGLGLVLSAAVWLHPGAAPSLVIAHEGHDDQEASVLHDAMTEVDQILRQARRSVRSPQTRGPALEQVVLMQQALLTAKGEVPPKALSLPESEQVAFIEAYRTAMIEVLQKALELELALLRHEHDEASEMVRDLLAMRMEGHRQFREEY